MKNHINPHKTFADFFEKESNKVLAYELSTKLQEGNICIQEKHFEAIQNNPFVNNDEKEKVSFKINPNELIGNNESCETPFIYFNDKYYLQRYFVYETDILNKIKELIKEENPQVIKTQLIQHKEFIKELFNDFTPDAFTDEENVHWQCVAALNSVLNNFSIITGGPGTGKTTTVAKILSILYTLNPNTKVLLTAPTGKASARMKESLHQAKDKLPVNDSIKTIFETMESGTIHSKLGNIKDSHYFKHNNENPLPYDVIIVDESSMIGSTLMSKLLSAVDKNTKIIFLGDRNQLASVEAGSIFGDFCLTQPKITFNSEKVNFINQFIQTNSAHLTSNYISKDEQSGILNEHIVELKRSYRFKGEEAIGLFSKAILKGKKGLSDDIIKKCDNKKGESVSIVAIEQNKILEQYFDYYTEYIKEVDIKKALKKMNLIKFLCATKKGTYGVEEFNGKIELYLQKKGLIQINPSGFYENQPILITKNNRSLGLFNGDIGLVRKNEEDKFIAYFEGGETGVMEIPCNRIDAYKTVYAMTIHKSQGSEFKHVGIVLTEDADLKILTRELIYTGVTRAKETAIIVGSKDILLAGCDRVVERASGVTERLINTKK